MFLLIRVLGSIGLLFIAFILWKQYKTTLTYHKGLQQMAPGQRTLAIAMVVLATGNLILGWLFQL